MRVGDKFTSTEEMEDLVLFDMGIEGLDPIRLSDVADVAVTDKDVYKRQEGDEEFEPKVMILWDENALEFLHFETLFYLQEDLLKRLSEKMKV